MLRSRFGWIAINNKIVTKSNITLKGQGESTILKYIDGAVYGIGGPGSYIYSIMFTANGVESRGAGENIKISDLVVDCNNNSYGIGAFSDGNNLIPATKCEISNVIVKNSCNNGFELMGLIDCILDNCQALNNAKSGFCIYELGKSNENLHIKNCSSKNNGEYGYLMSGTEFDINAGTISSIGYVLSNCTASSNGKYDFGGQRAYDVTIENCKSQSNKVSNVINFSDSSRRIYVVNFMAPNAKFSDVTTITDNMEWGLKNGLLTANESNKFNQGSTEDLSREHALAMLYRMEHYNIGADVSYNPDIICTDIKGNSDFEYLVDAIYWGENTGIYKQKIIQGEQKEDGTIIFNPTEKCRILEFLAWL